MVRWGIWRRLGLAGLVVALFFAGQALGVDTALAQCIPEVLAVPAPGLPDWELGLTKGVGRDLGVPADLVQRVVWVESRGNQWARGREGETGLMQVMPFHWLAGERPWVPYENVRKGVGLLRQHFLRTGDWVEATRRYNGASDDSYIRLVWRFRCD